MANPTGEADRGALRLDFDRRLMLQFRGSAITSDAGLLPYRELDDALSLTETGTDALADARTGKNGRHRLVGLLRQSVFGRLAGYEDMNDADRLCRDPAMRWVVGDRAIIGSAASASQMGRFETKWLSRPENVVLAGLPGQWIDKVHQRRPPRIVVHDVAGDRGQEKCPMTMITDGCQSRAPGVSGTSLEAYGISRPYCFCPYSVSRGSSAKPSNKPHPMNRKTIL